MENQNRQVLLKRRPTGMPTKADFAIADSPMPDPAEGEVLSAIAKSAVVGMPVGRRLSST